MSNMSRLAQGIEESCSSCQDTKCEGCKIVVDIGDKIVTVNGKTKEILSVKLKEEVKKKIVLGLCEKYSKGVLSFDKLKRLLKRASASVVLLVLLCGNAFADSNIIVKNAQREIGRGEFIFDNTGSDVKKYLNGREHLPWCAGFVSYVLRESKVKIQYTLRARDFLKLGKKVNDVRSGDLIVFSRGNGCGHVGIIERVDNNKIYTIEGNTGKIPSKVKRLSYNRNKIKNFLAFIRVN